MTTDKTRRTLGRIDRVRGLKFFNHILSLERLTCSICLLRTIYQRKKREIERKKKERKKIENKGGEGRGGEK